MAQATLSKMSISTVAIFLAIAVTCDGLSFRGALSKLELLSATSEDLMGTNWTATGIADDDGGMVPVLDDYPITLSFIEDEVSGDEVSGISGCNHYWGNLESMTSSKFEVGPLMGTLMLCEEDVMDQEYAFIYALSQPDGVIYEVIPGRGAAEGRDMLVLYETLVDEDGVESKGDRLVQLGTADMEPMKSEA